MSKHELNYRTETGEHVCVCGKYFVDEEQFDIHIDEVDDQDWIDKNWNPNQEEE